MAILKFRKGNYISLEREPGAGDGGKMYRTICL